MAMKPPHDAEREVRLVRKAASPHVIPLWEAFREASGHLVLVFPFMPLDLDVLLQKDQITRAQGVSCLEDLFGALAYLHSLHIIHRDVKPANILLRSASGPAYLADFGIAWSKEDSASEPSPNKITDVGTTCYRAPELLFGLASYTDAIDLWAAGCVVAEVTSQEHRPLFDSGELGSDLSLVHSIFKSLGTPNRETWPEAMTLPDWGKVQFHEYPTKPWADLLPTTANSARDVVGKLVRFPSGERLSAAEVLRQPFFKQLSKT